VLALDAIVFGLANVAVAHDAVAYRGLLPPETHVVSIIIGLALLTLVPRLLRGTRTAVSVAALGIGVLAGLSAAGGHWGRVAVQLTLCLLLIRARGAFPLGSRNRPRRTFTCAAIGAWLIAYLALRLAPLVHVHLRLHHSATASRLNGDWLSAIELLIGCAAVVSVLARRSCLCSRGAR
jgi:hypothetical protein